MQLGRPGRPRPLDRAAVALLLLVALAGPVTGCTVGPSTRPPLATWGAPGALAAPASSAAPLPIGPGGPGRTSDPISWSTCPTQIPTQDSTTKRTFALQCGQVQVPTSYTTAGRGSLSLAVTRARSSGASDQAPPLVVMVDDPGVNGTHQVAAVAGTLPAEILAHFAVIVVDVRGTGDSVPIDCVSAQNSADLLSPSADPTTSVAAPMLAALSRSLTFDCGDMMGPDLSEYSTASAADDLDSIRSALGVAKIDFVGRGFGATLGAVYADRYPGRIGTSVLDGPSDPSLSQDRQAVAAAMAAQQALSSFAAACQSFTGGCPLGSNPVGLVTTLVGRLGDIGTTSSDGQQITGGSVLMAIAGELGDPADWPGLTAALASAQRGDTQPIADLLREQLGSTDVEQHQAGRLVFGCNDSALRLAGPALTTAAAAGRARSPLFGPFLVGLVGVCASWPAPEGALGPVTAAGAPPILVVGAVDDPVAPYSEVRSLTAQLDSATLLSWQSGTNGGYPASSCVATAVDAYLLHHTVPARGTLCPP